MSATDRFEMPAAKDPAVLAVIDAAMASNDPVAHFKRVARADAIMFARLLEWMLDEDADADPKTRGG